MSTRICDNCGSSKEVKGGKTCETGHFICSVCKRDGLLGLGYRKTCQLCGKKLK